MESDAFATPPQNIGEVYSTVRWPFQKWEDLSFRSARDRAGSVAARLMLQKKLAPQLKQTNLRRGWFQ
jgi:hypothetical protein